MGSVKQMAGVTGHIMEAQLQDEISPNPRVRATLHLGSETYSVHVKKGILSEQLVSMKEESMSILKEFITKHNEESMSILKEFITKHNVPNNDPDEPDEISSEDDAEIPEKSPRNTSENVLVVILASGIGYSTATSPGVLSSVMVTPMKIINIIGAIVLSLLAVVSADVFFEERFEGNTDFLDEVLFLLSVNFT
ncbi:unnamed protein product [Ilex paraguariensis]|uniref:Uncharacterized protein n=1 Tax=Ilex paraguariensis TaxID=185542 RepID=A0ABC8UPV5_9AQUA